MLFRSDPNFEPFLANPIETAEAMVHLLIRLWRRGAYLNAKHPRPLRAWDVWYC